ncbi:MAG: 1-acyl-sn-glycerol-3-phosphate acyltransferase [Firmicutes bacterium]|nr:1-acyl-sn-glycerol-3-phosphate acyltransferase [Bacillota bacterium]
MEEDLRREKIYRRVAAVAKPLVRGFFGYEFESLPAIEGPVLMLCNHNTDLDCVMAGIAAGRTMSFVATENILRMGFLGRLIDSWFDIIVHYKGVQGAHTVKTIFKKVRAGSSVMLFPEGNRSFNGQTCPIPPATGKMARTCGATLVNYRLRGGYLTWPRWGKGPRKGRIRGEIAGIYSPAELKAMSGEEVQSLIERDLFVDAYEDQRRDPVAYKSGKPAESIESALFMCPSCGRIGGISSKKRRIFCSCGWQVFMDKEGFMSSPESPEGEKLTMTGLDEMQRDGMAKLLEGSGPDELLFSDRVQSRLIDENHGEAESGETELRAFSDRFEAGNIVLKFDDISGIAINQRNLLLIHTEGFAGHREFTGPISFSALKYLYLFRAARGSFGGAL